MTKLTAGSNQMSTNLRFRGWVIAHAFGAFAAVVSATATADATQPNFVVIAIDDLKTVIGVMGDEPGNLLNCIFQNPVVRNQIKQVLTPNIDRLAERSLLFTNAHAAAPICNASRVALMTGVRPDRSGITQNSQNFRKIASSRDLVTMPQKLKENGYFITGLGKVFDRTLVTLTSGNKIGSDYPALSSFCK